MIKFLPFLTVKNPLIFRLLNRVFSLFFEKCIDSIQQGPGYVARVTGQVTKINKNSQIVGDFFSAELSNDEYQGEALAYQKKFPENQRTFSLDGEYIS